MLDSTKLNQFTSSGISQDRVVGVRFPRVFLAKEFLSEAGQAYGVWVTATHINELFYEMTKPSLFFGVLGTPGPRATQAPCGF